MKILVTGSGGLVGSALLESLTLGVGPARETHQAIRLVRSKEKTGPTAIYWNLQTGEIDTARLEGFDAVVHLAGEGIAQGRWTAKKKAAIRESRTKGTRFLAESLARLSHPPKVLVTASAIGYYGNRGEERLNEKSPPGSGFLAEVCREWEKATEPAAQKGIRVVNLRTGIVLSRKGGALSLMLPPFQWGVGGILGSGRQYMSWIAIDDLGGAITHALATESLRGPVNAVTPQPVTNLQFTKILGRVLRRPTIFPLPAFVARLLLGQMADELLLASARVEPVMLTASGFRFLHPELEGALRYLLDRPIRL